LEETWGEKRFLPVKTEFTRLASLGALYDSGRKGLEGGKGGKMPMEGSPGGHTNTPIQKHFEGSGRFPSRRQGKVKEEGGGGDTNPCSLGQKIKDGWAIPLFH